ncbi:MAG: hypothetical protein V7638_3917, partial [Acidobacteriota bacterium]
MTTPLSVTCTHCGGSGRLQLRGIYLDTFNVLSQQKAAVTARALAIMCNCKVTAMKARLNYLERTGLVKHERIERERYWTIGGGGGG